MFTRWDAVRKDSFHLVMWLVDRIICRLRHEMRIAEMNSVNAENPITRRNAVALKKHLPKF